MQALRNFFGALGDTLHAWLFTYLQAAGLVAGVSPFNMGNVPTAEDFERGRVTNPDQSEISRGRLYDWLLYPAAGVQQLSFFSQPVGQGVTTALGAVVGSTKSLFDTNIQIANTLPSGKSFFLQSIEVFFYAGSSSAANTYAPAPHNFFNAAAAAAVMVELDDVDTFYQSGMLELNVLDKNYVRETPLNCFPQQVGISYSAAVTATVAAGTEVGGQIVQSAGRPYTIDVPFTLLPQQNFSVNLSWPGLVATPSTFNGRVGVILNGWYMRATQ
jgi:hypothetical protein